jgi:hypothetical protein
MVGIFDLISEMNHELGVQKELIELFSLLFSMILVVLVINIINELFSLTWWHGLDTKGTIGYVIVNLLGIYGVLFVMRVFSIPFFMA